VRVILTALAVPGFALGLATAAGELMRREAPAYGQPTSIVWADRVYSNKHDLATWLRARGASYETWAARHPAPAAVLDGRRARKLASAPPRSADSRQPVLAMGVLLASMLGLLALTMVLREWLPRVTLARSVRAAPRRAQPRVPDGTAEPASPSVSKALVAEGSPSGSVGFAGRVGWSSGGATIARLVDASRAVAHHARVGFERRFRRSAATVEYESLLARTSLRRYASDIALYAASVLLAVVIGASLALYLN
jgi:hypothetical protein